MDHQEKKTTHQNSGQTEKPCLSINYAAYKSPETKQHQMNHCRNRIYILGSGESI